MDLVSSFYSKENRLNLKSTAFTPSSNLGEISPCLFYLPI